MIQNETKTKTYTIDWKIPSYGKNSFPKKQKYESDCKPITIETPKWASIRSNFIIISKKFTKNKTNPYISTSNFNFSCKTKNIQMSDSSAIYNSQTQQWDLSLDDKKELIYVIVNTNSKAYSVLRNQIYQLKAKNATGWLVTNISNYSNNDPQLTSSTKMAWFCLTNTKRTQQLCGNGDVQYIAASHGKPELTKGDYTPYLIQILETIKFTDDK